MAIDMKGDQTDGAPDREGEGSSDAPPRWRQRARSLVNRLTLAEEPAPSAAGTVDPVVEPVDGGPVSTAAVVRLVSALAAGLTGGVILAATAPQWWLAPHGWRFTFPGLEPGFGRSSIYFGAFFLAGVLLLAGGWLGLLGYTSRRAGTPRSRLWIVIGASVLWCAPFTVSLPQLSTDVYAYGAQGYLATTGFDPSSVAIDRLPRDSCVFESRCYWSSTDSIWRKDPAPYGPVGVAVAQLAVIGSGYNTYWTTYAFRLIAMAGVVMAGFGVYQIARRRGVDESMALAIAVANPVVMIHLVGGAHNDALMMGLLLLGLASWEKGRKILAVVLITLAMCVKLPAVLALGYIAWNWWGEHREDDCRQRLRGSAIVGGLATVLVGLLCLGVGIRLGWLTALSSTNKVTSTFSFFTKSGYVTSSLLEKVGITDDLYLVTGIFRAIGLAIAAVVILLVLRRSPSIGVTKSTGIALLALMLLAPVVWPWYLPVAFALLAAVGVRRYRPTLIVLVIASSLLVWPMSVQSIEAFRDWEHALGLLVVLVIAGCCVGAQYLARASERQREGKFKVPTIEAVLITSAVAGPEPAAAGTASGPSASAAAEVVPVAEG